MSTCLHLFESYEIYSSLAMSALPVSPDRKKCHGNVSLREALNKLELENLVSTCFYQIQAMFPQPNKCLGRESEKYIYISPWPRHFPFHDMLANFARRTVRLIFLFRLAPPAHTSKDPLGRGFVLCRTSVDVRHSKDMPQCLLKITVAIYKYPRHVIYINTHTVYMLQ